MHGFKKVVEQMMVRNLNAAAQAPTKKVLMSSPLAQAHHSTVDYGVTVDTSGIYIRSFF